MKIKAELEPCPFCGGEIIRILGVGGVNFFKCQNRKCGATVSFDNDFCNTFTEQAVTMFNRRLKDE